MDQQPFASNEDKVQQWELINPQGTIVPPPRRNFEINSRRPATLEGKIVALLWNAKSNGDLFLGRVGELLAEQVKDVKVINLWELDPETMRYGPGAFPAEIIRKVKNLKPAIVIGSQGD